MYCFFNIKQNMNQYFLLFLFVFLPDTFRKDVVSEIV